MVPDSILTFAAAAALLASGIGGWWLCAPLRAAARLPLRFACVLLAALALAALTPLAEPVALLVLALTGAALALAGMARFARPLASTAATAVLVAALACGLGAMLAGNPIPALVALMLGGLAVIAAALNRAALPAVLSGGALLASGLCAFEAGVGAGMMLFCAAALVGLCRPQPLRSNSSAVFAVASPKGRALL